MRQPDDPGRAPADDPARRRAAPFRSVTKGSRKPKRQAPPRVPETAQEGVVGALRARVWFILTEKPSEDQDALRGAGERAAEGLGFDLLVRRSSLQRVQGGEDKDRPYRTLSPRDARDLYQDAHLRPCLVLATHSCHVRTDPSRDPATLRQLAPLGRFVEHKCAYALTRGASAVRDAVAAFTAWPPPGACAGQQDPRVLPMHVFEPSEVGTSLNNDDETGRFDRRYGLRSGSRTDGGGHSWQQATAMHGAVGPARAQLTVAGTALQQGFHWDVQRGRGRSRIVSESEVWLLDRKNAYLNAYPNGYLRGERQFGARPVWP